MKGEVAVLAPQIVQTSQAIFLRLHSKQFAESELQGTLASMICRSRLVGGHLLQKPCYHLFCDSLDKHWQSPVSSIVHFY